MLLNEKPNKKEQHRLNEAGEILGVLLKVVLIIGLTFISFGPNYSFVLLDLLYGNVWSRTAAPAVLSWYCVYILFIALNGITEAFMNSVINRTQLLRYNWWMVIFSIVYLSAAAFFLQFGPIGIVLANCINMASRITYSFTFIRAYFTQPTSEKYQSSPYQTLLQIATPSVLVWFAYAISFCITWASTVLLEIESKNSIPRYFIHIAIGAVCLMLTFVVIWFKERRFLSVAVNIWRRKKKS